MPAIDCRSLMTDIGGAENVTRERRGTASSIDDYGDVVGSTANTVITVLVHQADPAALQRLGLDLQQDHRQFFSESSLLLRDVIQYSGSRWEIVRAQDYSHVAGLYMAVGQRIDA